MMDDRGLHYQGQTADKKALAVEGNSANVIRDLQPIHSSEAQFLAHYHRQRILCNTISAAVGNVTSTRKAASEENLRA